MIRRLPSKTPPSHKDAEKLLEKFGKPWHKVHGVHVDAILWEDRDGKIHTTFVEVEAEDGTIKRMSHRTRDGFVAFSD